jgi:hypothetical protein
MRRINVKKYHLLIFALLLFPAFSSAIFAQTNAEFSVLNPIAAEKSVYRLAFTTDDTLRENAIFSFVFPEEFDVGQTHIAGSSTINGGFNLSTQQDTVMVARSGLGSAVPPDTPVVLYLALVKNPEDITSSYAVTMIVHEPETDTRKRIEVSVSFTPAAESTR